MDESEHFSPFSREDTAEQPQPVRLAPRSSVDGAWNFGKPSVSAGLPKMRRPIALGLVVVLVAAVGAYFLLNRRSASGGTAFALALSRNATYSYNMRIGMQGTMSAQGQQMPLNIQMDQSLTWRVVSTDSDGTATVAMTMKVNSAQFNGQSSPVIPAQTSRIRVAKDGRILSAGGFDITGFAPNGDLGSLVPGSDQFMPLLPDHPVNVGDSWTKKFDQQLPFGMGRLRYDVHSSLLRYEVIDGKRMAVLFSTLSLPLDMSIDLKKVIAASGNSGGQLSIPGGTDPKMKFGGSMSMQQTAWFDQAHGELYRTSGNATFDMSIEFKDFPQQANPPSGALHFMGTMNLQVQRVESGSKPTKSAGKQAQDRKAQADLRTAMVAAVTYYADNASFAGFTPAAANSIAPALNFNASGKAKTGQVSIRVGEEGVVLVTKSASGTVFCFGRSATSGANRYGKRDAKSYAACTGGW